jgi:hypothetical protein
MEGAAGSLGLTLQSKTYGRLMTFQRHMRREAEPVLKRSS